MVTAVAWVSYAIAGSTCLLLIVWYRGLSSSQWRALMVAGVFLSSFIALFLVGNFTIDYVNRYLIEYMRSFVWALVFLILGVTLDVGIRYRKSLLISYVLVIFVSYFAIDFELMRVNFRNGYDGLEGHYLFVSDAICIIAACLVATTRSVSARIAILISAVFVVFFVGSRASLWCFIAAALLMFSVSSRRMFFGTVLLFALGLFVVLPVLEASDSPAVLRIMEPLTDHGGESGAARGYLFDLGIRAIADHPIVGDLGGQIRVLESFGAYIHNILSFWRQFGIIGFIFISVVFFVFVAGFRAVISNQGMSDRSSFGVGVVIIFVMFISLSARSFASPFLWLIFGFSYREMEKRRIVNGSN